MGKSEHDVTDRIVIEARTGMSPNIVWRFSENVCIKRFAKYAMR